MPSDGQQEKKFAFSNSERGRLMHETGLSILIVRNWETGVPVTEVANRFLEKTARSLRIPVPPNRRIIQPRVRKEAA